MAGLRCVAVFVAVVSTLVPLADAATIVQSHAFTGQPTQKRTITFDRFDPSTGTLLGVDLQFDMSIDGGAITIDNDGDQPVVVNVELGAVGSLSSSDVPLIDGAAMPLFSGPTALTLSTGSALELAPDNGDGMTFDPTLPDADTHVGTFASTSAAGTVDPARLGEFVGTDPFAAMVDLGLLLDFGGMGGVSGQFDPVTADTNVMLTYRFEPVPEPSAWVLLVMGGFCLWIARKRGMTHLW